MPGSSRVAVIRRGAYAVVAIVVATAIVTFGPALCKRLTSMATISRAQRSWALSVHIGETRESVFATLGEPSLNWTEFRSKNFSALASMAPKNETVLWWQQRGLRITFVNGFVKQISVQGNRTYKPNDPLYVAPYRGAVLMGVTVNDDLTSLSRKLGSPEATEAANIAGIIAASDMEDHLWRVAPYLISISTWTKDTDDHGGHWKKGQITDSIEISDLTPVLAHEAAFNREMQLVTISGQTLSPKEIYNKYAHRVVEVDSVNSRDKVTANGTGVSWKAGAILTNRHVIDQARSIKVKRYGREEPFAVWIANTEQDWVALLPAGTNTDAVPLPPLATAEKLPEVGDEVIVIGNPEGLTNSLSTGVVAGIRKDSAGSWIQITAPVSHGSSGSPVFDKKGRLLGLATMMIVEGQNLNFAVPITQIAQACDNDKRDVTQVNIDGNLPLESYSKDNPQAAWDAWENCNSTEEVIRHLNQLLAVWTDPDEREYFFSSAAMRCDALSDYATTVLVIRRKIEMVGEDFKDWKMLGEAFEKMGRAADARSAFIKGIRFANEKRFDDDEWLETGRISSLAQMYGKIGEIEQERRVLHEYLTKHPAARKQFENFFSRSLLE